MKAYKTLFAAMIFIVAGAAAWGNAQTVAAPAPTVDEIVAHAAERSKVYVETFRNLLSEEKRVFEVVAKDGDVKKRREIDCTFLVYQSAQDEDRIAEYRNVTAVDGKKLSSTDDRAKDFFEKVAAARSSQKEIDELRDESTRYDTDFAISGLTLFQAVPLMKSLQPSFKFSLVGSETLDGKPVFVIGYQQTIADPAITINGLGSNNYDIEIVGGQAELNARIHGKLWIDQATFNLRKEVRTRTIQPLGANAPIIVAENIFEYTDTEFGILAPKHIEHIQYRLKLKDLKARKDIRAVFDYAPFTRPDVDVKASDIKAKN